jgi:hypothetical protein
VKNIQLKMTEVETLTYFGGAMDLEQPVPKRQRLDQNQFYLHPASGLAGPEFSHSGQFLDNRGALNHDELESAWTLNSLQTQNNDFNFSGFDATDLNLLSHQDQIFNATGTFFANDPSYGTEDLNMEGHSFPGNILNLESNEATASAAEVVEDEMPTIDQLCFGMVLSTSSSHM